MWTPAGEARRERKFTRRKKAAQANRERRPRPAGMDAVAFSQQEGISLLEAEALTGRTTAAGDGRSNCYCGRFEASIEATTRRAREAAPGRHRGQGQDEAAREAWLSKREDNF